VIKLKIDLNSIDRSQNDVNEHDSSYMNSVRAQTIVSVVKILRKRNNFK